MAVKLFPLGTHGVVFTLMAIVIASVIVVSSSVLMDSGKQTDTSPDHIRVQVVDSIINSFQSYAESALRVSVFYGLNNLTNILANQTDDDMELYFANLDALEGNLSNCILHTNRPIGPSGAGAWDSSCHNKKTIPVMLQNFSEQVKDNLNIDLFFIIDNSSFNIWEEFPFEATANLTMNITVIDSRASWNITNFYIETNVPLDGLQDPVTTKLKYTKLTQSNFPIYYFNKTNSPYGKEELYSMITQHTFTSSISAPSILQRFVGDFKNDTCGPPPDFNGGSCGVESFIDGTRIKWSEWPAQRHNYTHVDYELFVSDPPGGAFFPRSVVCDSGSSRVYAVNFTNDESDDKNMFWANSSVLARLNVSSSQWLSCP
ncbi:hypothetical protein GOV10_04270 [Candidatus Woesearchaeota archaeon]|nr:hypothetical protein [Candidatus Woesearchaeota archaeon]